MTDTPNLPSDRCALCGGPNACGISAGKSDCWCFDARVPQALVDRLPPERRGLSCICQACVLSYQQEHASQQGGQ